MKNICAFIHGENYVGVFKQDSLSNNNLVPAEVNQLTK